MVRHMGSSGSPRLQMPSWTMLTAPDVLLTQQRHVDFMRMASVLCPG